MPRSARPAWISPARSWLARRKRSVPPTMAKPWAVRSSRSRVASRARRRRVASAHAASASAAWPMAMAGPRHRPVAEHRREGADDGGRTGDEAQAQARQAVELAEGAQHDRWQPGKMGRETGLRREVGKSLVHDEQAAAGAKLAGESGEPLGRDRAAIGIVGIDEDDDRGAGGQVVDCREGGHVAAGGAPGLRVAAVGRRGQRDAAGRRHERQQADGDFAARRGNQRRRRRARP